MCGVCYSINFSGALLGYHLSGTSGGGGGGVKNFEGEKKCGGGVASQEVGGTTLMGGNIWGNICGGCSSE